LGNLLTDYEGGLDFTVKKTSKGGYADYSTSNWARKESAITADEAAAIEKFGLYNLADFLPKKPSEAELRIIKEMFEASVDGEAYDPVRWGAYYKPSGFKGNDDAAHPATAQSAPVPVAKLAPAITDDDIPAFDADETPVPVAAVKPSSQRAEDILAMIRNRQK